MTLERVADHIHMSHQNLGKIERYKVPYNQALLEVLAELFSCAPADLIMRDPRMEQGIWSIWDQLAPVEQRQVVEIAKALKKAG